jgi:preprotein translocase subunit SecY
MSAEIAASPTGLPELARRAAVTAGAVALLLLGQRVPLPLVDDGAFELFTDYGWTPGSLSPLALGVMPFVAAFLFVELVAEVLPRLRVLRHGSARDRLPLTRAAWALAAALAAWQGWGLAGYLRDVPGVGGYPALEGGLVPLLAVTSTIVLGTLFLGYAADLVSRHGFGNGFAVLLAVGGLRTLLQVGQSLARQPRDSWNEATLLVGLALAVVVPLVVAHGRRLDGVVGPRIPVPTCGLVVINGPSLCLSLFANLAVWFTSLAPLAEVMATESWLGTGADLALTAALALLLARLFCAPDAVVRAFRRAAPERFDEEAAAEVRRVLAVANRRSLVMVMGVALVPTAAALLEAPIAIGTDVLFSVAVVIAVALDLEAEARARAAGGALASARPLHRVYAVEPVLQALAAAGITASARARHFRALFHFFAPYAPIEILVPQDRVPEAEAICARIVVDEAQA